MSDKHSEIKITPSVTQIVRLALLEGILLALPYTLCVSTCDDVDAP